MSHLEHLLSWLLTTKHKAARHLLRADDTPPPACTGSPPHVISNHWGINNSRLKTSRDESMKCGKLLPMAFKFQAVNRRNGRWLCSYWIE
ncbi:hypothetical protein L2E82_36236 [Cichorium intybus]|uniref:Uncharacterized protein n=1 Tax=Cichorium intybus TaxID=13427 RepID=A0ACB9BR39_CICIN|nr:hypothetical protein L2E82_36236 [Cichorium intybus]